MFGAFWCCEYYGRVCVWYVGSIVSGFFSLAGFEVGWERRCGGGFDYPYSWIFFSVRREWLVGGWVLICCWRWVECVWCGGRGLGRQLGAWW